MKKIIFLHSSLNIGGAEKLRLSLLKNIDTSRYEIKICCIDKKGPVGKEIENLGYTVDELSEDPHPANISAIYRLVKYLRKERPDILHSSLFNANFHGRVATLFYSVPYVITEEHSEHLQYKGLKFFPYRLVDHLLSYKTDFIVCCSDYLRGDIIKRENLPSRKVISIENCLDRGQYNVRVERKEIRDRYNIEENEVVFIVVGSLSSRKGHGFLLDCLSSLKQIGYHFRCFLAGDGPLKNSLEIKAGALKLENNVIFLGNIDSVPDYLNASDIFVLPSFFEGLPIALIEALLLGKAGIVTDVGSNSELVKDGFDGKVIGAGDKSELINAAKYYFENREAIDIFGRNSRDMLTEKYLSFDVYKRKFYELWDSCNKIRQ